MAGRGPAPKHTSRRARTNGRGEITTLTLREGDASQPDLPENIPWPDATVDWWAMWGASPQSAEFGPTDWAFLLETALLHADVWSGNLGSLPELRLRVAKFGATPEDRARLKMQYAQAAVAEDNATQRRERRERTKKASGSDPRDAFRVVS